MMKKALTLTASVVLCGVSFAACSSSGSTAGQSNVAGTTSDANFGTMKNVCHKATGTNVANSDRGVTADSVRVTTISDAGSSIQRGLNQELWDVAHVFADWCNANGGINGRKILMTEGDAQLFLYKQTIDAACASQFALVGGGGAFDDQGQKDRVKCLLPDFGAFAASSTARTSALSYSAAPTPVQSLNLGGFKIINELYPGTMQRAGIIYGAIPSVKMVRDQDFTVAHDNFGLPADPVYNESYPPAGTDKWGDYAKGLAEKQVSGLIFSGQPKDLASLITAIKASGYKGIKWVYSESNMYDDVLIKRGGTALDSIPSYTPIFVYPFEEAGKGAKSAAIDKYLALFKKYLPDGKAHAMLGLNAFASWLLFAQSAGACGDKLDRKCLVNKVTQTTNFDAGGLIPPRNPSDTSSAAKCFTVMKATSKGFTTVPEVKPNTGPFNCDPSNAYAFQGDSKLSDYAVGPSLADVDKSLSDLP